MSTKSDSVSRFYLSETDIVPFEVRQKVIAELHEDAKQQANKVLKDAKRLETLHDKFTVEMENLVGKMKYERFRQYVINQRASLLDEMRPQGGLSIPAREKKELYEKRNQKIRSYLKREGVSEAQIKRIAGRYKKRFARLDDKGLPPKATPARLVPSSEVPKEIQKGKTNRRPRGLRAWQLYEPPFANWNIYRAWFTRGFYADILEPELDIITGHIYNKALLLTAWPPGDNDLGLAYTDIEFGFWYLTQHNGPIDVWIAAEANLVFHKLDIWDYAGWSDSHVSQHHYLTLRTDGSRSRSFANMSSHWWDGYTDVHDVIELLTPGDTYWAHIHTPESFTEKTFVLLWFGSRTYNYCLGDDVNIHSYPIARWYIKQVYVD